MMLSGKVIIITGACTGIGKAVAIKCVQEGAKVVINGLEDDLGVELIGFLGNENAELVIGDITESHLPNLLVETAKKTFGKLDAVVNNAAFIATSDIDNTEIAFFEKMFKVNTIAPFALIQASTKELSNNGGCVVNIGSINAWGGEPHLLAYSVSKGALMTLTRNLGDSLFRQKGIRVNQINPGWVLTDKEKRNKKEQGMKDNWFEDISDFFAPAGRIFKPEEIANMAAFLLSDQCGPVSSQVFDMEQFPLIGRNMPKDIIITK
ncbi:SDR family NAD(P)-dependent oxidoreductase [Lacihabitans soyangensis]|jgi:NAD(P)-dependent dehydrogenase (short-subunit alcohol dehydrogenase family)|uniref:SDR family oxidoreductase n=1 Tax=Lacihabitans soyangensis TaxID=869394 RepID=A0AAE3GZJ1_9BACT|nr:SDR family oxidoreductase [Lacihabitans soyangensis]MCP9761937.1 SDR family oxidoreductase [Lacihabitans soyangensis]